MKSLISILIGIFVLVSSIVVFHVQAQTDSLQLEQPEVIYPLPYPGLLTDHPLYPLKELRDKILIFTTRDNVKKAQFYLHLSDKRMATALQLAQKGKEQLSKRELINAETYFLKISPLLKDAKKQGSNFSEDFVIKLQQSNAKHKEVITDVMKDLNQAEIKTFQSILEMNQQATKEIAGL
ncbi:hypothetical protein A3A93_03815 [Candidatus Roizmanbacteria bacterium RIFCSPLOWO2_01_FULL_38_12]|uniref:DUF5667 domain-containing protein n=1 Tax=Candidatus Roizmanbacteria bacterium RIFCSPLOWO2_01_FULL_38_12 TaxID=1802061 RepID=A0A1F7IYY9_9BACT|nr:MAG: hypothetical protein A2861_04155 [Candidatus Roizmanbacteria bacterium RIFCSPHIGHO2_01_FULL_38_15]OGK34941.1 MAG: hypothetical protein A3F59_03765 [Candidatus Roizmanbacteria bacterium RIFCSPHIGHO2_12_FULL_38_13]OGK48567.1 MAG: hypothetical protein A3A93_03815 [Candidatus Roizmanbacteria bacterium RIFCSPLOWO2_01_FULL_38_12]